MRAADDLDKLLDEFERNEGNDLILFCVTCGSELLPLRFKTKSPMSALLYPVRSLTGVE